MSNFDILMEDVQKDMEDDILLHKPLGYPMGVDYFLREYKPTANVESVKPFQLDKPLEKLLSNNSCTSFSDYNEIYGILAPIAFDLDAPTKDIDTARIGIFRLFASNKVTDSIIKDMTERFIFDEGKTSKNCKLYYEFLTKHPIKQEDFSRIHMNFNIPLQYHINIATNPFNQTKEKEMLIDTFIRDCIEKRAFQDSNFKNACIMAEQGSIPTETQKVIVDENFKKRPIAGIDCIMRDMIKSGKVSDEVYDYIINKAGTAEKKLEYYIHKAIQDKQYNDQRYDILYSILEGHSEKFENYLHKIKEGKFWNEDKINEIIQTLKDDKNVPKDVKNLLESKESALNMPNELAEFKCYLMADRFMNDIKYKVANSKKPKNALEKEIQSSADLYVVAKKFVLEYEEKLTKTNVTKEDIDR